MKKTIYTLLIGTCIAVGATSSVYAQSGTLDPTFGIGGIVTTDIGPAADKGFSVIQQTDGKLLVAGLSNNGIDNDFAVIRYNINGSLDNTFGIAGTAITPVGSSHESGQAIILQPDDKILVAGFTSTGTTNDFALVRYNPNGSLDITFGAGGIVTTDLGGANDQGQSVVLQPDGKIIVAGFTDNGVDNDFGITRYNINGSLDTTFGIAGIATTDFSTSADVGRAVALQTDGKIVVAGWSFTGTDLDFALARYDSTGNLDNTFDTDGKVTTAIGAADDQGFSIAIQADGKIVVGGMSNSVTDIDFAIIRYNTDGSLDNTFDTDGRVTTDFSGGNDFGYSIAVQPDTRILLGGQSINAVDSDFGLARYNTDGSLDITFNLDGKVTTDLGSNSDVGWSVAIQIDEKVVVAGSNQLSSYAFGVTRYNVCGNIDTAMFLSGPTLFANAVGLTYQWLNCDSANAPIVGETNQDFTPANNGNYSVIIISNDCSDTSSCYHFINPFGISENSFAHAITLYPNPTNGPLILLANRPLINASVRLVHLTGQTILQKENLHGTSIGFDISEQPAGIYYIEVTEGLNTARMKVVKK